MQAPTKSTPSRNGEAIDILRRYALKEGRKKRGEVNEWMKKAKSTESEGKGGVSKEVNEEISPSEVISQETWLWLKHEMVGKRELTLEQAEEMIVNDASMKKLARLDKAYLRNMREWMGTEDNSDKGVEVWWKSESAQLIAMSRVSDMC